jgi:VWFA-related protein
MDASTRRIVLAGAVLLSWLRLPAAAQEEPIATFDDLSEVKEVLLDVLAVDGSGQIVTGLGKDDFVIEEDGEAVEVTGVSFYATRYGPAGVADVAGAIPSSRYFILFFHDRISTGSIGDYLARQRSKARRASLTWVAEHMLPSDWIAVVSYDLQLKIHQDFTQDRAALAEAVKSASARKDPERGRGRRGRPLPSSGAPSLLRHLPAGKALRQASGSFYDGVRLIAEASGYAVGRKNLVLYSPGFGELDSLGSFSEADARRYPPMVHALNDHNVAVYPVDLTPVGVEHLQSRWLVVLALATGGRYARDPISFLAPLQEISDETAGYYLVSYQSRRPALASGYQRVEVRPRDPSVTLRARTGYRYGAE